MKLYYNGTVITMASAQTAEALLTDGGVIRAAGPAKALRDMARGGGNGGNRFGGRRAVARLCG